MKIRDDATPPEHTKMVPRHNTHLSDPTDSIGAPDRRQVAQSSLGLRSFVGVVGIPLAKRKGLL